MAKQNGNRSRHYKIDGTIQLTSFSMNILLTSGLDSGQHRSDDIRNITKKNRALLGGLRKSKSVIIIILTKFSQDIFGLQGAAKMSIVGYVIVAATQKAGK